MFGIKSEKCTLHSLQGTLIPEDRIFLALERKGISEFLVKEVDEGNGNVTDGDSDAEPTQGTPSAPPEDSCDQVN